ncbi:type VI secretion system-associated protein TagF [Fulvimarina sp. MAC3]|uniref:type VI secretion system-associated protein TagF n=1 Tax=Fulvimarina sp. MAC3 TaxID=3148887 RepID=UPI0031FBCFD1
MGWGLFGKLPAKRDFVALHIPRTVLEPYETWVQGAMAASRNRLGGAFDDSYLISPIWRFVIGREIYGRSCAGALMPSVDRVGRLFPLTIVFCAEPGEAIAPPTIDAMHSLYETLDDRLLGALEESNAQIDPESLLHALPDVPTRVALPEGSSAIRRGLIWQTEASADEASSFEAFAHDDYANAAATRSYWWTTSEVNGSGPFLFAVEGMPDPYLYVSMLDGRFVEADSISKSR